MTNWRKSSRSGGSATSDCVELARFPRAVGVRDGKDPDGANFALSAACFRGLVVDIKRGAHDLIGAQASSEGESRALVEKIMKEFA
ncbi:DUF397 domain-containing protein [Actinomadura formosensis]|uniref:DUF397 domain-containing protein n=1 Tax=Actinomadura formosensis TaxID=60706 RepID=UPI003D8A5E90